VRRRGAVRGTRLAQPTNQVDRGGRLAERRTVDYWCADDHHTTATFAADVGPPAEWPCRTCGAPAAPDHGAAPRATRAAVFFRTPLDFLKMRRTTEDGERILNEALAGLASARAAQSTGRDRRR
jgi:hypothetical protein